MNIHYLFACSILFLGPRNQLHLHYLLDNVIKTNTVITFLNHSNINVRGAIINITILYASIAFIHFY